MKQTNPEQPLTTEVQEQSTPSGIPWGRFVLLSLFGILALAVLLNWIPVLLALTFPLLIILVAFAIKFRRDNRDLVDGATSWRFIASSISGFLRFIPGMMILAVAFLIVWAFDFAVDYGTDKVAQWAESEDVITTKKPKEVERHPLSPWRIFGDDKKWITETYEISEEKSAAIKFAVRTAVNFLEVVTWYPWVFLGYITLRSYFHFWARAFVARGGTVTMQFPEARR